MATAGVAWHGDGDGQCDDAGMAATADAARATAEAMAAMVMAMAGWVSLGGRCGPVIVSAVVPASRCGVVSDEVAGLGAFHVLTSSLLPRLHGVS
jgi:hypothetical protein